MSQNSHLFPNYNRVNLEFTHGENSHLFTKEGEKYLDFTSGIAVNVLGHANLALAQALSTQAQKLWHISNLFCNDLQEELAQKLCKLSGFKRAFFTNSGTESVECAIKTARHYFYAQNKPKKQVIVSFTGCFHGRTLGALAATARAKYLEGFGEKLPGFIQLPLNCSDEQLEEIADVTAAFIIEPIQGEGGINVIDHHFLQRLRSFCDKHDILLIFDEIQCGIGRTGKFFAFETTPVKPDIITLAKALGGGFPVGACLCAKDIALDMLPGTHGATFGGNMLAMKVALKVVEIVSDKEFLHKVNENSAKILQILEQFSAKYPNIIKEIRGKGLMIGVQTTPPAQDLILAARNNKLLVLGSDNNIVRILPSLNINEHDINEFKEKFDLALSQISTRTE